MNALRCSIFVFVQDFLKSRHGLSLVAGLLGLQYTSIEESSILGRLFANQV